MSTQVTIILPNVLETIGLRHVLEELSTVSINCLTEPSSLLTDAVDKTDWYITNESIFLSHLAFFLPYKDKTVVLTQQPTQFGTTPRLLCVNDAEEAIISSIGRLLNSHEETHSQSKLTQREIAVLKLVASGLTNKMIADNLNISINTVLTHRKNITAKLGIKSVSGLSVYAIMNGIITA